MEGPYPSYGRPYASRKTVPSWHGTTNALPQIDHRRTHVANILHVLHESIKCCTVLWAGESAHSIKPLVDNIYVEIRAQKALT